MEFGTFFGQYLGSSAEGIHRTMYSSMEGGEMAGGSMDGGASSMDEDDPPLGCNTLPPMHSVSVDNEPPPP